MIRRAKLEDVFVIRDMWDAMFTEIAPDEEKNKDIFVQELFLKVNDPQHLIMVAEEDGVVGFIMGFFELENYSQNVKAVCEHLYVDKEHRDGKISEKLVDEYLDIVYDMKVKRVEFITTERLAKFWERKGYKKKKVIFEKEVSHGILR